MASKPPGERPPERPAPWHEQIAQLVVAWIGASVEGKMDESVQAIMEQIKYMGVHVEAANHGPPTPDDAVWPIIFRDSGPDMRVRECLLDPALNICMGKEKELGVRPARHQPTGPARAVLENMGLEYQPKGGVKGKQRRSPKREVPQSAAASPVGQRRRQG